MSWLVLVIACGGEPSAAPDASVDANVAIDLVTVDRDARDDTCARDADCSDALFCNGIERCAPRAAGANALGCVAGVAPCMAAQTCDEAGARCVTQCSLTGDADGDGVLAMTCGGADCDDADPLRFPGAREYCDAASPTHDEDCDMRTYGFVDVDMDGYALSTCCNGTTCGTDCNDADASIHPALGEICDTKDNDCDGTVDENARVMLWPDVDGDLFGDARATPMLGCASMNAGTVTNGTDCDDAASSVHPGGTEVCSASVRVDEDCDEMTDEIVRGRCYVDADRDSYAATAAMPMEVCLAGGGCPEGFTSRAPTMVASENDCDDASSSRKPGAIEACNSLDEDCDTRLDEEIPTACYADGDGDGYAGAGVASVAAGTCGSCPTGYTPRRPLGADIDCAPNDSAVFPGAIEICNRRDDDCSAPGGGGVELSEDADGDLQSATTHPCRCDPSAMDCLRKTDCDDNNASAYFGQTGYFPMSRLGGSFDYNCDGVETPALPVGMNCSGFNNECYTNTFYNSSRCGQPGQIIMCRFNCSYGSTSVTIECH